MGVRLRLAVLLLLVCSLLLMLSGASNLALRPNDSKAQRGRRPASEHTQRGPKPGHGGKKSGGAEQKHQQVPRPHPPTCRLGKDQCQAHRLAGLQSRGAVLVDVTNSAVLPAVLPEVVEGVVLKVEHEGTSPTEADVVFASEAMQAKVTEQAAKMKRKTDPELQEKAEQLASDRSSLPPTISGILRCTVRHSPRREALLAAPAILSPKTSPPLRPLKLVAQSNTEGLWIGGKAGLCKLWRDLGCFTRASPHPAVAHCGENRREELQLCTHVTVDKVLHIGSKTALYSGAWRGTRVGLKHFPVSWYKSFVGFEVFGVHSHLRHPWINYPEMACLLPGHQGTPDSVLQAQLFLPGKDLGKWRETSGANKVSWSWRLRVAMHLACIHEFLHTHPDGPFTFDDNHPGQYFLTGSPDAQGLMMVDIDTIQRTLNGTSRCRCFGCNGGRANCQFANSPEGYRYCGAKGVARDRTVRCTPSTDIWYVGQLLLMLLPRQRGVMLERYGDAVAAEILRGTKPEVPEDGLPEFAELVLRCLSLNPAQRPTASELASTLITMCSQHSCGLEKCPKPYYNFAGYGDRSVNS